ncbi:hypothetical protein [Nodularia sphaerocarpa]|nr:hypothetical protein [Nodularia sphaerocarpa]
MEKIIRSNAVVTSSQGRSLEMIRYDFYFYYYLASQMVSTYSSLVATIKMNLPTISILVCLLPQTVIFWLLVLQSEAKTLFNCFPAKRKKVRQLLRTSEMSGFSC